ncbi:hypothetical protein TEA_005436 [Camellia sinensis var. sinensis]|uniref:UBL3-like ubiquitin domain-containing protein n=1 Tax=Camellia sinensis var. sinensis TaxID=542762 RepID=A0A4S4DZP6_CAMSN|nr:hypothetical protein TEA_005436 [Camellia sinensis var. sinensis]
MAGEDLIELKFRLADGTDIGPSKYNPSTTVGSLKEKIIAQWPKGCKFFYPLATLRKLFTFQLSYQTAEIFERTFELSGISGEALKMVVLLVITVTVLVDSVSNKDNAPKTINDVKLINAGKILENNKTLAESRLPIGELPGAVITMHVVVRPPFSDKNNGRFPKEEQVLLYHPVMPRSTVIRWYSWLQLAAETRTLEVFCLTVICCFDVVVSHSKCLVVQETVLASDMAQASFKSSLKLPDVSSPLEPAVNA